MRRFGPRFAAEDSHLYNKMRLKRRSHQPNMKTRTLSAARNPERHEYFCSAVTPNSDFDFGKNLVRSSRQSATGANRRFQLQKSGPTPSPNSNRRIRVHSFLAWRKRQCWRTANSAGAAQIQTALRNQKSESDIRHQIVALLMTISQTSKAT